MPEFNFLVQRDGQNKQNFAQRHSTSKQSEQNINISKTFQNV